MSIVHDLDVYLIRKLSELLCDLVVCKLTSSLCPLPVQILEIVVEAQGASERSNIFLKH